MIETHEPRLTVRRRDGSVVVFDENWIEHRQVQRFTELVVQALCNQPDVPRQPVDVDDIQDQIELVLMRYGERLIARDYVIRRERHRQIHSHHGR